MKLFELHHGGMHAHLHNAMANLQKHVGCEDEELSSACKTGIDCLKRFAAMPGSTMQDPHTFAKLVSHYHGKLDKQRVKHANDALGTFGASDND